MSVWWIWEEWKSALSILGVYPWGWSTWEESSLSGSSISVFWSLDCSIGYPTERDICCSNGSETCWIVGSLACLNYTASAVERTRRSSTLPSVSPRRAKSWHPYSLRHFRAQIASLESWEYVEDGCRRFANLPSRRDAVGWARDTCLGKKCGCDSGI